jgi:hypothetical protein
MPSSTVPKVIGRNGDDPETTTSEAVGGALEEKPGSGTTTTTTSPPDLSGINRPISEVQATQDPRTDLRNFLEGWYEKLEDELGLSKFTLGTVVEGNWEYVVNQMTWATDNDWNQWLTSDAGQLIAGQPGTQGGEDLRHQLTYINGKLNPRSLEGAFLLQQQATTLMDRIMGINSAQLLASRGGGGGGGGRRAPTPAEIRQQFDVDALANNVNDIWRAYMVEEAPAARAIAAAYVEAIVSTGGEQKIDFQTFVRKEMQKTGRWQTLYKGKPEGMDELQHLAPYIAATQQAIGSAGGTGRLGQAVLEGAALGATSEQFANKLAFENEVQESSSFITALESRLGQLNGILRG